MKPNTVATAQLYTDAATGQLLERQFCLRVVSGPDAGTTHTIEGGTTLIGTHEHNDLVLTDNTVSRYHLELQVRRDGLLISDLETTNGTKHAGMKIGSITITGAARLRLGKRTEIDIVPTDEPAELDDFHGDRFGNVLGRSAPMQELFKLLARVAPTEATLLLEGETGTGKEAIAEAIHNASNRASKPFVVVDCGAIPHELIGSELFGHVKGAYTGAATDKAGLIETASGGTLFLDEIGELALDLQPQLLRVLDKRQVRPVGETKTIDVDIRVIAATHRDLRAMIKEGTFREDLYFRLAVVRTEMPPLRRRREDIGNLAEHLAEQLGRPGFTLSPELRAELDAHDWPGNVRELRNVVERALSLGRVDLSSAVASAGPATHGMSFDDDSGAPLIDRPFKDAKADLIERFERDYLNQLLDKHRGNISRAAAEAGIDRNYIHRLIKKYGLTVDRG